MVAYKENAELAKQFIEEAIGKHQVPAGQLTIHADRGHQEPQPTLCLRRQSVFGKSVPNHEVPPGFPDRFGCIQDSRAFCQEFFQWYNEEHRHSGIALLTPAMVHFGEIRTVLAHRQVVLDGGLSNAPRPLRPAGAKTDATAFGG